MSGKRKRKSETTFPAVHEENKLKNDQTVHKEKKPPQSSNGHNAKTPICQEIDSSVDHDKTKDKNSSNDHIKSLITIKLLTCTYCEDNIDFLKTLKDVENHILRCNAPYMQARNSSGWRSNNNNKEIEFVDENYTTLFYWICPQKLKRQPIDYSTAFFQCSICPSLNNFQDKDIKTLIKHQKDDHNIEYSAEFLSEHENVDERSESDNEGENSGWIFDEYLGSDSDTEDENSAFCLECVEKSSKIQALKIECADAKIKLGTEVASMKKALEKSNAEYKVELEKVENQLETEAASKKALEESLSAYRKLRQDWAVKVYQSNHSNEDLDNLLSLEPEKLFNKYEQIMKEQNSDKIKLEETTETLQDVKIKLKLQTAQKGNFEKQLSEIREVLHLPDENCNFGNILPVVKDLLEQNEINHCSNGLSIVESSSSQI